VTGVSKELRKLMQCEFFPNWSVKSDGTCSRTICQNRDDSKCAVNKLFKILKPKTLDMNIDIRKSMMKTVLNEDKIVELLKTKPIWDVTEQIYGVNFDHSDRDTWIFYSKINRIRRKFGLPRVVPR